MSSEDLDKRIQDLQGQVEDLQADQRQIGSLMRQFGRIGQRLVGHTVEQEPTESVSQLSRLHTEAAAAHQESTSLSSEGGLAESGSKQRARQQKIKDTGEQFDHLARSQASQEELPIHELVERGKTVAGLARKDKVPTDVEIVNQEFTSNRLRAKVPLVRRRVDVWDDGRQVHVSSFPVLRLIRHISHKRADPAKIIANSAIEQGKTKSSTVNEAWLLSVSSDRGRDMGVFLTEEGDIGIYDLPKGTQDIPVPGSNKASKATIPENQGVYAPLSSRNENGILYLDSVADDPDNPHAKLPKVIQMLTGQGDNRYLSGLEVIESGLLDFAVKHDLDQKSLAP